MVDDAPRYYPEGTAGVGAVGRVALIYNFWGQALHDVAPTYRAAIMGGSCTAGLVGLSLKWI